MFYHGYFMHLQQLHELAGKTAGLFAIASYFVYNWNMVRSAHTASPMQPPRSTWFIWMTVSILLLAGLIAHGEKEMIWIPWSYAVGSFITFLFTLRYGKGGWEPLDRYCLAGAAASLAVWAILGTPTMPIYINLAVDVIGFVPMLRKAWINPISQRSIGWVLFAIGNFFNMFSVTEWNPVNATYNIYMLVTVVFMTGLVYWPEKRPAATE